MPKSQKQIPIAIRKLKVKNFKAFDDFEIEFPKPRMKNDPDVFLMGSKNGVGKTSVLEACALLLYFMCNKDGKFISYEFNERLYNFSDLLIRSGENKSVINGVFSIGNNEHETRLIIEKSNQFKIDKASRLPNNFYDSRYSISEDDTGYSLSSIIGLNPEPLLFQQFMYFHSYRKVLEGNPELGMIIEKRRQRFKSRRRLEYPVSSFKLEILRLKIGQADLFENIDDEHASKILNKLNSIVERYSGGTITKLLSSPDNTIDFRITPTNGGESFAFDGLSSGQKEIISTLFLIWYYSRSNPSIVLIDEPELHLNAEWHRDFVKQVHQLAPQNQYIIATHSADIFSSVEEDRRVLLTAKGEKWCGIETFVI